MYVKRVAGAAFAAALGVSGLTVGAGLSKRHTIEDRSGLHSLRVGR